MTRFDKIRGIEKEEEKQPKLKLILEEDDNILAAIEQGMRENEIKTARIDTINGKIKSGLINSKEEGKKEVSDIEVMNAAGTFKFGGEDLWGTLSVFLGGKKPLTGELIDAIAEANLEILMSLE